MTACLLVVAKAPVAGLAKTRLAASVGPDAAAHLAASALLDTLAAVLAAVARVPDAVPVVALTGDLAAAQRPAELATALSRCVVLPQRGADFGARLTNAHLDVAARFPGAPVFQVGMDTPQLTPELLTDAMATLRSEDTDAVLGPATDGGWWGLGLRAPAAATALLTVPMSRPDTGARTLSALHEAGLRVRHLTALSDVDTLADATRVATIAPATRFARAFGALTTPAGAAT